MTLAVFRQLPKGSLVNANGTLNGTPWGRVNYHSDCSYGAHLHIVWENAGALMHSYIRERAPTQYERADVDSMWGRVEEMDHLLDSIRCLGVVRQIILGARETWDGRTTTAGEWSAVLDYRVPKDRLATEESRYLKECRESLVRIEKTANLDGDLAAVYHNIVALRESAIERNGELYAELCQLPQLFIAA